jgi:hypothetical protein
MPASSFAQRSGSSRALRFFVWGKCPTRQQIVYAVGGPFAVEDWHNFKPEPEGVDGRYESARQAKSCFRYCKKADVQSRFGSTCGPV